LGSGGRRILSSRTVWAVLKRGRTRGEKERKTCTKGTTYTIYILLSSPWNLL
jgi:hypothetical protein